MSRLPSSSRRPSAAAHELNSSERDGRDQDSRIFCRGAWLGARKLLVGVLEHPALRLVGSVDRRNLDDRLQPARRVGQHLKRRRLPNAMRVVGAGHRTIYSDIHARRILAADLLGPTRTGREKRADRCDSRQARTEPGAGRAQTGAATTAGTATRQKAAAPVINSPASSGASMRPIAWNRLGALISLISEHFARTTNSPEPEGHYEKTA
jgi:hypothetical protein